MAMSRMLLWAELSDAADAVKAAAGDYTREPTCESRDVMIAAYFDHADALYPVVGQATAFAYEASLATVFEATGTEEEAAAQQAHAAVMVDLERAVIRAMAPLARGERELTRC